MSKFYIKFLAILGVFLISTSSTFAATYYNCAYDITNAANWYTDSGCSTPAGVVPTVGDIGELVGAGASAPGIVTIDYTLNLQSGATLEFYSAGNTLTGTINVNSGSTISFYAADTINITGNNTGNLNGGGVINFSSTSNVYFYDGILNISPGQSLSFDGTGTVFGTYINPTFGAGSIININSGARLEVNGITVNMTSTSTNYNTGNIAGSGILNIATSSILFVSGGTLNISGGFSVGSGASSNGLFECTSGANINVSSDVGVYNNGTVNTACNVNINSPGSIKIYPGGSLTNSSFFYIFSGASLQNIGGTIDAGDYLLVYTGGSFSTLSGTTIVHNFGSFGSTTISNGASFTLNGTFDNYGDFLNHGNVTFTGGYSWYGYATSTFRNFSDGYMDLGSTISQNEGAIINEGTMIFGSGQFIQIAGASILNSLGAFFTSLAEIIMPNITFTNLGWFNFGDGAVITNNAGTFTNSSTGTFNASSTATFTTNAGGTSINNNPTSFALTDSSFPFDINSVNPLTNYNVTRSHTPTSYSISILPDGLTFSTTTGIISGTPGSATSGVMYITALGSTSTQAVAYNFAGPSGSGGSGGGGGGSIAVPVQQIYTGSTYISSSTGSFVGKSNPNVYQQQIGIDLIGGGEPGVPKEFSNYVCQRYLREYILPGQKNNPLEVKKLQIFLNENEGEKLKLDGTYDADDILAVKRFQAKYLDQIMAPWGVSDPTGRVFRTTTAKINLLMCAKQRGCPYFKEYLNKGDESLEAIKVQDFLNIIFAPTSGYPDNALALTKEFNTPTKSTVENFQNVYKEIVLRPWDLTNATGRWYQTTRHAANKLMNCNEGEILLENGKSFK